MPCFRKGLELGSVQTFGAKGHSGPISLFDSSFFDHRVSIHQGREGFLRSWPSLPGKSSWLAQLVSVSSPDQSVTGPHL